LPTTHPHRWCSAALILAVILLSAGLWGCGGDEPESDATSPTDAPSLSPTARASPATQTPATPEISWPWLSGMEYRGWDRAPGWSERLTTDSPHSQAKEIFIDPALSATIGSGAPRFPAGATIVKEGYDGDGDLAIVAVMQRMSGDGWFFAEYRADGSVIVEGEDPQLCTQCHQGSQDGVLAFTLE
jgi:hypothetical protein